MAINSDIGLLMQDIQEDIQGLSLTGLADANVVILPVPMDDEYDLVPGLPAVVICPFGTEVIGPGTNASDEIMYPILVAILQKTSDIEDADDPVDQQDIYLNWRQQIFDNQIHNRTYTNADGDLVDKTIELNPIVNVQAYLTTDLFISALVVRCNMFKTRRA